MPTISIPGANVITEKNTPQTRAEEVFQKQRTFYNTLRTHDVNFRLEQLATLYHALEEYQDTIGDAMYADLKRSRPLSYYTEIGLSLKTISLSLRNLKKWAKPKKVKASWDIYPFSKCWVQYQPFGQVLNISPWNYPITLTMGPLTAILSAGNTAILKPSENAPHVSGVIAEMIRSHFDEEYIAVFEGDKEVATELLALPFDHIMYTGGTAVGKVVMEAASKHLTPVTLELGGKSPAIVDQQIDLEKSAKRIVAGKYLNCGQTCIAPDHIYVHEKVVDKFVAELQKWIEEFYGKNAIESSDYGKMINRKHFDRVKGYLDNGQIVYGGECRVDELYISPTIMVNAGLDSPIMKEEIFGPILPIITYSDLDQLLALLRTKPKPLALYVYSTDQAVQKKVLSETTSGGAAINDSVTQFVAMNLPFGGIGNSGMGRYHGKFGFETFSHQRAVMKQTNLIDLRIKYPPVTEKTVKFLKGILK